MSCSCTGGCSGARLRNMSQTVRSDAPVLRLDGVAFRRQQREILTDIHLTVRPGEHWALLGPNGAGKSTLLNLCAAVTFPSRGHVEVLGHRMGTYDLRELRREIGYVNPRHPLQSNLEVEEIVLTGITGSIERVPRWEPTPAQLDRAHELMKLIGDVRSELFHYEVRATYDTPEVADSRRIVREAIENRNSTWERTEWTPDGAEGARQEDEEDPEGGAGPTS